MARARESRRESETQTDPVAAPGASGSTSPEPLDPKALVRRSLILLAIAVVITLGLLPFSGPISRLGRLLGDAVGLPGVFLYVYVVDTLIVPATLDVLWPMLAHLDALMVLSIVCLASILGGFTGYLIGRQLNYLKFVARLSETVTRQYGSLVRVWGVWGVVVAGITPVPFSTVSWAAGALRLHPGLYLLGALSRIPRIVVPFLLVRAGMAAWQ